VVTHPCACLKFYVLFCEIETILEGVVNENKNCLELTMRSYNL